MASAIEQYESEPLKSLDSLKKVKKAINNDIRICHPVYEEEIINYVRAIEDFESKEEREEKYKETFLPFIEVIANEIESAESKTAEKRVEQIERAESDKEESVTRIGLIKEALEETFDAKHVKLGLPIVLFVLAVIVALLGRLEIAAVILGGLTFLQTVVNVIESEKD